MIPNAIQRDMMTEAKLRLPPTQHFYDAAMRRSAEINRGIGSRSVSLDEAREMALRHLHEMERRRAESAAEAWATDEMECDADDLCRRATDIQADVRKVFGNE